MSDASRKRFELCVPDVAGSQMSLEAWAKEHGATLYERTDEPLLDTSLAEAAYALGTGPAAGNFAISILRRVSEQARLGGVLQDARGMQFVRMPVFGADAITICGPGVAPEVRDARAYAVLDALPAPFGLVIGEPNPGRSNEVRSIEPTYVTKKALARYMRYKNYPGHVWHEDIGRALDILTFAAGLDYRPTWRGWNGPFISKHEFHAAAVDAGLCDRTINYLDGWITKSLIKQVEGGSPQSAEGETIVRGDGYDSWDALALASLPAIHAQFEYSSDISYVLERLIRAS